MAKKLRMAVLVSGGGTNLQAIIDGIKDGTVTNAEIAGVISNNPGVYSLERAENAGIPAYVVSPKSYRTREDFNIALKDKIDELGVDLTTYIRGVFGDQVDEQVILSSLAKMYFTEDYASGAKLEELQATEEQAEQA